MYIKTLKLERAALKDYRNDPLTDEDEDDLFAEEEPKSYFQSFWDSIGSSRVSADESGFEGGSRRGDIEMSNSKSKRKKN